MAISGTEGIRKPSRAIYGIAIARTGVPAERCVFIDDSALNLAPARDLGMTLLHRRDATTTSEQLDKLFPSA